MSYPGGSNQTLQLQNSAYLWISIALAADIVMFTREKVKVNPANNKTKRGYRGKNSKAAWETLLTLSRKDSSKDNGNTWTLRSASAWKNGYPHIKYQDDDGDNDDDASDSYDKYNNSVTPSASFNFSGSHSKSLENLWRSASAEPRVLSKSLESRQLADEFYVHTGQPPVSKEIVEQICGGKYINFQELLQENLGKENVKNKKLIDENGRVDDITKWIDCMAVYIAVFTSCYSNRIRDLLAYQGIITRLYRECQDKKAWQRYDVAFRRKAFQNGLGYWSAVDENLWILSSSHDARRAVLCKPCLSLGHNTASCPLKPKEESLKTQQSHSW